VAAECLRLSLADEVRYSIVPVVIGDGISFFQGLNRDVALHLREITAYTSGIVALRYDVPEVVRSLCWTPFAHAMGQWIVPMSVIGFSADTFPCTADGLLCADANLPKAYERREARGVVGLHLNSITPPGEHGCRVE
jgi:hypothetical protein